MGVRGLRDIRPCIVSRIVKLQAERAVRHDLSARRARSPTPPPARSSRRSIRPPPTCRRRSASTRASSTRARRTRRASALEGNLAAIEGGRAGFAFASGMAAINAIASMLKSGDHVVVSDNVYGGTFRLFEQVLSRYQLTFTYVDTGDLDATERAFTPTTRMLFVETPSNPVMRLTDLARGGRARPPPRRAAGRRQHVRQPVHPAADRARRRPRHPQHDQVPERPQRQRRRHRHRHARRRHRVAASSCRTPPARS